MGKGNRRISIRVAPDLLARVDRQRESLRWRSPRPPYDLSDVVRRALEAWLAKYERSAGHRRPRKASRQPPAAVSRVSDTPAKPSEIGGIECAA